ncbi:hypothetical protein NESM_000632200 [Novymonas esmeraldas]|uniref:Uncharacterized protein n=1 Tax=Novymonas esmeraldas TaxID=1808958 RepID=A0AAW0ET35_9TRYP
MLLRDDSIAQQFAVIARVAQLLQQVVVTSSSIVEPRHSIAAARESGGSTAATTMAARAAAAGATPLPFLRADSSAYTSAAVTPTKAASQPRSFRGTRAKSADRAVLQNPLQLPRVCTDESIAALRQLGFVLDDTMRQLQSSIDAQLLDFYAHLKGKADAAVPAGLVTKEREVAARRREGPQERVSPSLLPREPTQPAPPPLGVGPRSFTLPTDDSRSSASLHAGFVLDSDEVEEAGASSTAPFPDAAHIEKPFVSSTATAAAAAPRRGGNVTPSPTPPLRSATHSRSSSGTGLSNAPMARRIEEERAAASELQSFFFLLLESALRLSGATAAAVYMDDAAAQSSGGTGGSFYLPTTGSATVTGANSSGRAQFLHCVAHAHGHFPSSISCAVTNVLTTVASTGVAVNVQYSESSLLRLGTSGNSGPGVLTSTRPSVVPVVGAASATDAARHRFRGGGSHATGSRGGAHHSLFDMYNGVIVPIKGMGCLVLANKAKLAAAEATAPRFSVFDEHVAWSSALLCEVVLHRYERQLLLRATWAPSCVAALRPFVRERGRLHHDGDLAHGGNGGGAAAAGALRDRRGLFSKRGSRRFFPGGAPEAAKPSAADVDNAAVSSLVFDPQNDIFSKTLTMVRTGDPQVVKALPQELRSLPSGSSSRRVTNTAISAINTAAASAAVAATTAALPLPGQPAKLSDEEVFQAAAQYITNLESLWRRTISESNMMHIMVENYNKEMRKKEETIALLELKVRDLNYHVGQLERRGNYARLNAV